MCGVGGIRKYGDRPIEEIMIRMLLLGLETRGNDATGIALQNTAGDVFVHKNDVQAWKYVNSIGYKEFLEAHLNADVTQCILHTRAATKGIARINNNNHPLFAGKAAIIHNGMIHNDDQLFRELDIERNAETDTDIIRGIIDKFGFGDEAVRNLNKLRGSAAIAVLHPEFPGKMIIGRSGSPLCLGSTDDFLFFASEKNIIHRASRPWVERFNIHFQQQSVEMAFSPMADDTIWILGDDGLEHHSEFRTTWGTYKEPVRRIYSGWKDRQDKWTKEKESDGPVTHSTSDTALCIVPNKKVKVFVRCPNPACPKVYALGPDMQDIPLSQLQCTTKTGGCGKPLTGGKYITENAGVSVKVN